MGDGPESPIGVVRRLWQAYVHEGPEAFVEHLPDGVVWRPLAGGGIELRTRAEISQYLRRQRLAGGHAESVAHRFEQIGRHVLVTGGLRRFEAGGFTDSQPAWVFFFDGDGGRLTLAAGYPSPALAREALAAAALA